MNWDFLYQKNPMVFNLSDMDRANMKTIDLNIALKINMALVKKVEGKLENYMGHLSNQEIKKRCSVKYTPPFKKEYYLGKTNQIGCRSKGLKWKKR